MRVPVKEDMKKKKGGKKAFSACNYIHNKLNLHVCATRLNKSEM